MLLHRAAGDELTVLHVTDGRRSRALGLGPAAMAARRRAEAAAGVALVGASRWEWLGLPEGEWHPPDLELPLERLLDALAPDVVYVPSCVDFHPEHRAVARVVARCLAPAAPRAAQGRTARSMAVRVYEVQVPLTNVLVNLVAPIAAVASGVRAVAAAYGSQADSLAGALRLKRYAGARHGLGIAAESFWELSPAVYAFIHGGPIAATAPGSQFRGFRRLAMTDPLAFARGRRARHRLRVVARRSSSSERRDDAIG
jgi:LmbE family N-acetylglucosaminyl deacetylase